MRTGALIEALPVSSRWDFGGHAYGLEPLTLPDAATSPPDGDDGYRRPSGEDLKSSLHSLRGLVAASDPGLSSVPGLAERLFWFRWITGHQITFILWQLLAQEVRGGAGYGDLAAADQERCRVFLRGYSSMLLYTGSCPRDTYHQVIRPSMALQHPGFSGSWARDFWPVRSLLRPGAPVPPDSPLGRECALNILIHEGIADKLVPSGQSLLQSAVRQGDTSWKRPALAVLYDMYFLTLRAAVPYEVVVRQLMRRLHACGRDIAANGLYPAFASSAEEMPARLRTPEVQECERGVPETLFAIATHVAGGPRDGEEQ